MFFYTFKASFKLEIVLYLQSNTKKSTMDYGNEFKKFAISDQGISSTYYDKIVSSMTPTGLTPNIIEERQMNVAVFDVFSRLMMDRIIFMGTGN